MKAVLCVVIALFSVSVRAIELQGIPAPAKPSYEAEVKHITEDVRSRTNEKLVTSAGEYTLSGIVESDQRRDKSSWNNVKAQLRYSNGTLVSVIYF